MALSETLLRIDGLQATYHHTIIALDGVTLSMAPGEIVALLGANGAGKSTSLQAVTNLLPARRGQVTSGRILFEGRDITRARPAEIVRLGIVPVLEGRHCFRGLTIEENLLTGGLGGGLSSAALRRELQRVYDIFPRLAEKRRAKAGLASGGEQQMTAIGRALMARPRLLVLDEPSMGLAPLVVDDIFRVLQRLNADGMAILVAEQNSTIALRYANRAYVIENGRVVLDGPAAALRERDDIKAFYLGLAIPRQQAGASAMC